MKIKFSEHKPIVAVFFKADDELHSVYDANEYGDAELEFSADILYTVKGNTVEEVMSGKKANRCPQDGILPASWQSVLDTKKTR